MIIDKKVYYIYKPTKSIKLYTADGQLTENIEKMKLFKSMEEAEDKINNLDEPHNYEVGEANLYLRI